MATMMKHIDHYIQNDRTNELNRMVVFIFTIHQYFMTPYLHNYVQNFQFETS